ncbi:hypothetical protein Tco_0484712 [Tanacetum coccineum]
MGCCLISWFSKKQTALAISITEAEYVSTKKKACQHAFWMKLALVDYDIKLDDVLVLCDNKGAIDLNLRVMMPLSNLITALAVVRNGVPKMKVLFSSSFMSKIMKSTWYT